MRFVKTATIVLLLWCCYRSVPAQSVPFPKLALWYNQPATLPEGLPYGNGKTTNPWDNRHRKGWVEALPIGNGKAGAMVFGGIARERIQLNEESLWAGYFADANNPKALSALPTVRRLMFEGKEDEAEELSKNALGAVTKLGVYQTMGDLWLRFDGLDAGQATDYQRSLDLEKAITTTSFTINQVRYQREAFASHPQNVLVLRLTASTPAGISTTLKLTREKDAVSLIEQGKLVLRGQVYLPDSQRVNRGMKFETQVKPVIKGGTLLARGDSLVIRQASEVVLYIAQATSYTGQNPTQVCSALLSKASARPFQALRQEHITDYQKLFGRLQLTLNGVRAEEAWKRPTNELVESVRQDSTGNDFMTVLQYQYARYLMIACSRPGDLPANLQGLWNEHLKPAWASDYHTNINLQMNYWFVETANLADCHKPLIAYMQQMIPYGQQTARKQYGAGGWVMHHAMDIFGRTAPDQGGVGVWPVGGAWLSRHAYEHFLFSHDKQLLRTQIYPQIKGAAQFMLDFLVEIPEGLPFAGRLVTNPSHSPENTYEKPDGKQLMLGYGATMDTEIIQDVFDNCLEAIDILSQDTPSFDQAFRQQLLAAKSRLVPIQIGPSGRILEWMEDYKEPELGHRHISHLYSLYPDNAFSLVKTPALAQAALRTLETRLKGNPNHPKFRYGSYDPFLNGKGGTGWGRVWVSLFYSRLGMGNEALRHHRILQSNFVLPNLMGIAHGTFQIDNVFGNAATTSEMLIQSQDGFINLLPALPDAWASGQANGFRATSGFEVSMSWAQKRLTSARIQSRAGQPCRVKGINPIVRVSSEGKTVPFTREADGLIRFNTQPGKTYTLSF